MKHFVIFLSRNVVYKYNFTYLLTYSDVTAVPVHCGEQRAESKSEAVYLLANLHPYPLGSD